MSTEEGLIGMTTQYSPSDTKLFIECPTKWQLSKLWEQTGEWSPKFIYGLAVGRAFEVWLPEAFLGNLTLDVALSEADDMVDGGWIENDAWTAEALKIIIHKGIIAATKTTLATMLKQERFISVEDRLGKAEFEKGAARMDLITMRDNTMIVTDHKTKLRGKQDYIDKDLLASEHEWQFWDYAYRVLQCYKPKDLIYRVHIGVLTPTPKWFTQETRIPEAMLDRWHVGAMDVWEAMENAYNAPSSPLPMHLQNCESKYGKCEFYEACHTCNLDEARIEAFYNRKEVRRKT